MAIGCYGRSLEHARALYIISCTGQSLAASGAYQVRRQYRVSAAPSTFRELDLLIKRGTSIRVGQACVQARVIAEQAAFRLSSAAALAVKRGIARPSAAPHVLNRTLHGILHFQ